MNAPFGIALILAWMLEGILSISLLRTPLGLVGLFVFVGAGALGYTLAEKGGAPFREGPLFIASRWANSNLLFPTQVAVSEHEVIRYKKRWIGKDEETITIRQIASVRIATGILWSDVVIESTGGAQPIVCYGHRNADARAIKALIEQRQQATSHETAGASTPAVATPPFVPTSSIPPEPSHTGHLLLMLYADPDATESQAPLATYPYALSRRPAGAPSLQAIILDLLQAGGAATQVRISYASDPTTAPFPLPGAPDSAYPPNAPGPPIS